MTSAAAVPLSRAQAANLYTDAVTFPKTKRQGLAIASPAPTPSTVHVTTTSVSSGGVSTAQIKSNSGAAGDRLKLCYKDVAYSVQESSTTSCVYR